MKIVVIILILLGAYMLWSGWSTSIKVALQDSMSQAPAPQAPAPQTPAPQEPAPQAPASPPAPPKSAPSSPVTAEPPEADPLAVTGIIMGEPPMAIVGGQAVSVGEKVGRYKVMAIGTDSVKYRGPHGKIVIKKIVKEE